MGKKIEMTTRNKQELLAELLCKVQSNNKGFSADAFKTASTSACIKVKDKKEKFVTKRCEKAAAVRFFKYLKEQGFVGETQDRKGRCCIPEEYRNDNSDAQMLWLKEVVEFNDPFKNRGRIKNVSPRKKIVKPAEESIPENPSQMMTDIVIEIDESPTSILEDVEIINPQIMEDDILDGYNEITGEFDNLPKQDSITQLMIDLAPLVERAKNLGITIVISNK